MNPHQELIDQWCRAYVKRFGSVYVFAGGKDGVAVKNMIVAGIEPVTAVENAKKAWDMPQSKRFWNCNTQSSTLCGFGSAYNKIIVELSFLAPVSKSYGRRF